MLTREIVLTIGGKTWAMVELRREEFRARKRILMRTRQGVDKQSSEQEYVDIALFGGWQPLKGLSLRKSGLFAYALEVEENDSTTRSHSFVSSSSSSSLPASRQPQVDHYKYLILRTGVTDGCRTVEVRSPYHVCNGTQLDVALRLRNNVTQSLRLVGSCAPGSA